jgi:hypothetical protein
MKGKKEKEMEGQETNKKSLDKHYNYQTRFARLFNRIYIPISTHTAQSACKSPYSQQMAHY